MSPDPWLRPNRRVLLAATLPVALALVAGAWLGQPGTAGIPTTDIPTHVGGAFWIWSGRVVAILCGFLLAFLVWQAWRPRLAYADGHLLVYLRAGGPVRVPLEAVECFLLGQGATLLEEHRLPSRTVTLLVRLAEKRTEWAHVEVHRLLGAWCGGQITIRGTWCEPLSLALVNQLNERLAATQAKMAQGEMAQGEMATPRGSA